MLAKPGRPAEDQTACNNRNKEPYILQHPTKAFPG